MTNEANKNVCLLPICIYIYRCKYIITKFYLLISIRHSNETRAGLAGSKDKYHFITNSNPEDIQSRYQERLVQGPKLFHILSPIPRMPIALLSTLKI